MVGVGVGAVGVGAPFTHRLEEAVFWEIALDQALDGLTPNKLRTPVLGVAAPTLVVVNPVAAPGPQAFAQDAPRLPRLFTVFETEFETMFDAFDNDEFMLNAKSDAGFTTSDVMLLILKLPSAAAPPLAGAIFTLPSGW